MPYLAYFFPGVVLMVVLFASIFTTASVIEDRHRGFLQSVLAAPGSRGALVAGKTLGSAAVALTQAVLFLALAPLAGFPTPASTGRCSSRRSRSPRSPSRRSGSRWRGIDNVQGNTRSR